MLLIFLSLQAKLQEMSFNERGEVLELASSHLHGVIFDIMEYRRAIPGSPDNLAGAPAWIAGRLLHLTTHNICHFTTAVFHWFITKYVYIIGWPSLHIRRQTHWLQVIYKSLLGKAPPYLSSLVTIAAPTRSAQVYFTGHPQSQFLSVLCCQWLERIAKIIEAGDSYLPH